MSLRLFGVSCAIFTAGAHLAACSVTETRTVVAPNPADESCVDYGYTPGTDAYGVCLAREAEARRRGRMTAGYAQAQIVQDARDACISYGLERGSVTYDRCVQREVAYRSPA